MHRFPEHYDYETLIASQMAARNGIDNTPSERETRNLVRIAWFLETLRFKLKVAGKNSPIVSSGFRNKELNVKVGGSRTSVHMSGLAADFAVRGMTSYELVTFIENNMVETGWDQVINEYGRWVHVGLSEGPYRLAVMTAARKTLADGTIKTVYVDKNMKV